jgi:hypothetical protein
MYRYTLALSLLLASTATAWAQCRQATATPLHFQPGRTTAIVKGQLAADSDTCYKLRARANQQMTVHVTSPKQDIHFNLFPPSQDATIASETADWSGALPATGDYTIALYTAKLKQGDSYTLEVSISALKPPPADNQPAPPADTTLTTLTDATDETFDAYEGPYVFDGKAPAGFEGFQGFEFPGVLLKASADRAHVVSVSQDPHAQLLFRAGRVVKAKQVTFTDDQIGFETEIVRGVSYQFSGRFIKDNDESKHEALDPKLKGRITKLVNGKKTAEAQMSFYQVVGG